MKIIFENLLEIEIRRNANFRDIIPYKNQEYLYAKEKRIYN